VDRTFCLLNDGPLPSLVFYQDGEERTIVDEVIYYQLLKESGR
jgi:hypothetical protein